jgi:hypothetical protein
LRLQRSFGDLGEPHVEKRVLHQRKKLDHMLVQACEDEEGQAFPRRTSLVQNVSQAEVSCSIGCSLNRLAAGLEIVSTAERTISPKTT